MRGTTSPAVILPRQEIQAQYSMLAQNSQSFQQNYDKYSSTIQSNTQPKKLNGSEINKYVSYMCLFFLSWAT